MSGVVPMIIHWINQSTTKNKLVKYVYWWHVR